MKGVFTKTLVIASLVSTGVRAEVPVVLSGSQLLKAAVCQLAQEAKSASVASYQIVKDNVYKGATYVGEKAATVAAYTKPAVASTFAYGKSVYVAHPETCKVVFVAAAYAALCYGAYKLSKWSKRPVVKPAPVVKKVTPKKVVAKAASVKSVPAKKSDAGKQVKKHAYVANGMVAFA